MKKINIISCIISLLLLTSCGFQMRGKLNIPNDMENIYVHAANYNLPFYNKFRSLLAKQGITVHNYNKANNFDKSYYRLQIDEPVYSEQVIAYDLNGRPQRIQLVVSLDYKLFKLELNKIKTAKIIKQNNIQRAREITVNPNQMLVNTNEKKLVQLDEISYELLRQIIINE